MGHMEIEYDNTKPLNHYVNIHNDSKVVQLYLRRHADQIVIQYNNDAPTILQTLNNRPYEGHLTMNDIRIPYDEHDFNAADFIYDLIYNEDLRMFTRSIRWIANQIRERYQNIIDDSQ